MSTSIPTVTKGGQPGMQNVVEDVQNSLKRYHLPQNLKDRLVRDACNGGVYYQRISSVASLTTLKPNSGYLGVTCGGCTCHSAGLIEAGNVGLFQNQEDFSFLAPGYHSYWCCGRSISDEVSITMNNRAVSFGPLGFITITEGFIGVIMVGAEYRLLPPGTYQWSSPCVNFLNCVDVTKNEAKLGPYTLITVPDGEVAVTFNNGDLHVLGAEGFNPEAGAVAGGGATGNANANANAANPTSRTFFLDDVKWIFRTFLSLKEQTDRLEGNDLLSRDNVELIMVAMSQWRIVNAELAVTRCDTSMDGIRVKINNLVRAAIARIVAGTNIGSGPVSGGVTKPAASVVQGAVVDPETGKPQEAPSQHDEDATLSHLMQSDQANRHMAELCQHVQAMGVEVVAVFVPEKRMKNEDIRQQIAKQAVIGIKAEADRSAADAKAYATVIAARASATAISELAQAHADAGDRLGDPNTTASRLAITETTAKALEGAKLTVYSGGPANLNFMQGMK